jgi:hypothetical protein
VCALSVRREVKHTDHHWILGCLVLAVTLLSRRAVSRDTCYISHINWSIHVLLWVLLELTIICYHHWLHMGRWCSIDWMSRIKTSKHITLSACLVRVVEHAFPWLLFVHRSQLSVVHTGLDAVKFCSNLSSEWALLLYVVFASTNVSSHDYWLFLSHVLLRSKVPWSGLLDFRELELLIVNKVLWNDVFSLTDQRIVTWATDLHMSYWRLLRSIISLTSVRDTKHMLLQVFVFVYSV